MKKQKRPHRALRRKPVKRPGPPPPPRRGYPTVQTELDPDWDEAILRGMQALMPPEVAEEYTRLNALINALGDDVSLDGSDGARFDELTDQYSLTREQIDEQLAAIRREREAAEAETGAAPITPPP